MAVLIQRRGSHLDDALVGTRLRGPYFEHFAFDPKLIAWPNRSWPAEFVEAGADDAADRGKLALDQQPHRDRGGVPAACGETAKYRVGRRAFIEVKGLWIEFGGKALDAFAIDADAAGPKGLSRFKVFQVSLAQIGHADEAKSGEAIGVPLSDEAMAVQQEEKGKHRERVFTFKSRPLGQVNSRSWRNALQRAGIKNVRWHDHVWATWHVMAGTTIAELQELGAWKSELMVKRYAHFAPEQLRSAATRLGTFLGTPGSAENAEARTTS